MESSHGIANGDEGGQQNCQEEEEEEEVCSGGLEGPSTAGSQVPHEAVLHVTGREIRLHHLPIILHHLVIITLSSKYRENIMRDIIISSLDSYISKSLLIRFQVNTHCDRS